MNADDEFQRFVIDRTPSLRGLAFLLAGSWSAADDLLQEAFIKAYLRWRSIHTNPEAYVRRILVTVAIDERRRPHRRETPRAQLPEHSGPVDEYGAVDSRLSARAALESLPPRQRAAVALRYWLGLDPPAVAELLGCSVGTVKSQSARGLAKLRTAMGDHVPVMKEPGDE